MEWLLTFLITTGGLIGVIPPKLPCTPLGRYLARRQWSIGTAYCVLILLVTALIWIDYLWNDGTNYFGHYNFTDSPPTSVCVINVTIWFYYLVNTFMIRLNALYHAAHFAKLLRKLSLLHTRLDVLNAKSSCNLKEDVKQVNRLYHALGAAACIAIFVNQVTQSRKYYDVFNQQGFHSWWLPKMTAYTAVVELFPHVVHCFTVAFAMLQFLLLGTSLLSMYTSYGSLLRHLWESSVKQELVIHPKPMAETFGLLQESMMMYNTVCGLNMFVLITTHTIGITWVVYGFYLDGLSFGVTSVIAVVLIFLVLTSFGECFETKMEEVKAAVHASVVLHHQKDYNNYRDEGKLLEITQWYLQWQWRPTARGFYPINHSLVHTIASASLTYTIFVFQLRASETPSLSSPLVALNNSTSNV